MKNKGEMVLLKTANSTTWSLKLGGVQLREVNLDLKKDIVASFNPALPYIYLPDIDFNTIAKKLNKLL